jgi:putative ABC transport system substrate-binding protein
MNRRDIALVLLVAAATGHPLHGGAQQERSRKPYVIGLLPDFDPDSALLKLLAAALAESGRVEGRDYVFYRSGVGYGVETQLALDRVMAAKPDLIFATNLGFAIAAHKITQTIPIVMWVGGFPVEAGVADSLARPGKNVTGMTLYAGGEVFGKLVQLVHEVRPGIKRVGALMSYVPPFHPRAEADLINRGMRDVAGPLGLDLRIYEISKPEHIDEALAAVVAQGVEALVLTTDPSTKPRRHAILQLALDKRLPTITDAPWDESGALLGYWADFAALIRQSAPYVSKILWQGAKPADLPIQLPARFEFVVNLKTAKAIGVTIPQAVLTRADRLIE